MKYSSAALAMAFLIVGVSHVDAARQKPYAQLTLQEKLERSLQCSAKANEAKLPLDKRQAYITKCKG